MSDPLTTFRQELSGLIRGSTEEMVQQSIQMSGGGASTDEKLRGDLRQTLGKIAADLDRADAAVAKKSQAQQAPALRVWDLCAVLRIVLLEKAAVYAGGSLTAAQAREITTVVDAAGRVELAMVATAQTSKTGQELAMDRSARSLLNHDLRGHINAVSLMVEVVDRELTMRGGAAEMREDFELIRNSLRDMVEVIDRVVNPSSPKP